MLDPWMRGVDVAKRVPSEEESGGAEEAREKRSERNDTFGQTVTPAEGRLRRA